VAAFGLTHEECKEISRLNGEAGMMEFENFDLFTISRSMLFLAPVIPRLHGGYLISQLHDIGRRSRHWQIISNNKTYAFRT
jgi:hypothetical protein